jgi:hypothetical protein
VYLVSPQAYKGEIGSTCYLLLSFRPPCFQSAIKPTCLLYKRRIEGTIRMSGSVVTVPSIAPYILNKTEFSTGRADWRQITLALLSFAIANPPHTISIRRNCRARLEVLYTSSWRDFGVLPIRHYSFDLFITKPHHSDHHRWRIEGTIRSSITSLTVPSIP